MTDAELKQLKDNLWHSADVLRAGAHLAANKYGQPILGLIFLRYADILFKQHKDEIEAEYNKFKGGRMEKSIKEIAIEKCGFFLPECAYYDYINDAPDDANKATIVKKAMEAIEDENPKMLGVLPKEVYAQLVPEEEPELLSNIVRIFKDIPENCTVDIFGEIYEYFLGNFALAEGKDGGTFYTPATVVRYMHNHNASEAEQMKFRCYGVEKEPDTVKLAKMNLLLNNVRGEITEANTFYSDPYNSIGQFDYVMANPPFNVDEVNYERVSKDDRFTEYGVPRNKSKSSKKESDKKETVPNANYLWIGLFAAALNYTGKAALVMANQASDASGSELDIRKKLIELAVNYLQHFSLPSLIAKIRLDDVRIILNIRRRPLCQTHSEVQHRNLLADAHHEFHIMLNEQNRNMEMVPHLTDHCHQLFRLLRIHAGRRLIQQKKLRLRRHGAGNLKTPLHPIRQVARFTVRRLIKVKDLQQFHCPFIEQMFLVAEFSGTEHRIQHRIGNMIVHPRLHIIQNRHVRKQTNILERTGDPGLGHINRRHIFRIHTVQ